MLFWSRLKEGFPEVEEKPPVSEVREEFEEDDLSTGLQVRWQFAEGTPSPRLWAKSSNGKHTIQIQADALMVNWERDASNPEYWPYQQRRDDFANKLNLLAQFLGDRQLGTLVPTTCFVTYINHIDYPAPAEYAALLQQLLTTWRKETSDGWLPPVERASLQFAFVMPEQRGRLYVNVAPGVRRRDKKRIVRLDLTARGAPRDGTLSAALDWIDLGHEWIVRGFASLTRPEMHQIWRRTQ